MKVSDLKVGDICMQRNGTLCIVLSNNLSSNGLGLFDGNGNGIGGCVGYLGDYNDDLTYPRQESRDILAVYKASEPNMCAAFGLTGAVFERVNANDVTFNIWTWQGNKEVVKEMTVAEIEKLVGSKVKIIKES